MEAGATSDASLEFRGRHGGYHRGLLDQPDLGRLVDPVAIEQPPPQAQEGLAQGLLLKLGLGEGAKTYAGVTL